MPQLNEAWGLLSTSICVTILPLALACQMLFRLVGEAAKLFKCLQKTMGRRRRNNGWESALPQLAAFLVLLGVIYPGARRLAFEFLSLAAIAFAGFVIYQLITRARSSARTQGSPFRLNTVTAAPSQTSSQATPRFIVAPDPENAHPPSGENCGGDRELLESVQAIDWFQFEKLMALVYRKLDYSVSRRGGANPDGGIDMLIRKDAQTFAVQCKHWKRRDVGIRHVREFLGALTASKIQKGIFITLCGYTGDAKALADQNGIEILSQSAVMRMLKNVDAQYDPEVLAILNDSRKICPKCESEMKLRTCKRGPNPGSQFWGCSTFPKCDYTLPTA
jgi:hypothetical protein